MSLPASPVAPATDPAARAPALQAAKVAVIGAGLAGLSCAEALRGQGREVWVFDKSRGPSGRASTRRGDGWACDHGAQYFTARDPGFVAEVGRWMEAGVAGAWTPRLRVFGDAPEASGRARDDAGDRAPTLRYVGVPSMTAPAQWLAARHRVLCGHTVDALRRDAAGWRLRTAEHGWLGEVFDAVLLALPAPQAAALLGGAQPVHAGFAQLAASADMQPCWTVMAVYDDDPLPAFDAAFVNQPLLSWVCADHRKPGRAGAPCWLLHAQPEWSREWLEAAPGEVVEAMLDAFAELGAQGRPRHAVAHRWRYARGALPESPRAAWDAASGLGLCGDWLCGGRVEGAWCSGHALASELAGVPAPSFAA